MTTESWNQEIVDANAPPTENWADDVPTTAPVAGAAAVADAPAADAPAPAAAAPFQPSNDWGAPVS